jgi:luciferase family oxidoreductase group 1
MRIQGYGGAPVTRSALVGKNRKLSYLGQIASENRPRASCAAAGGHDGVLRALRVGPAARDRFPSDVRELQFFFREPTPDQEVHAVPGAGLSVPIWLLGSSTFSAEQAGALGLPFSFATHIGPDAVGAAIEIYRSSFKASEVLARPYVMITALVIAAETDEAARHLFTSIQQIVLTMLRSDMAGPLPPPVRDLGAIATPQELAGAERRLRYAIVGSRKTVSQGIEALIAETAADELSVLTMIYDLDARRRSFEIVAEARDDGVVLARTKSRHDANRAH